MLICFTWQAMRIVLEKGHNRDQICKAHRAYRSQQQHSRNLHRVILCSTTSWMGPERSNSCSHLYLTALVHQRSIFKSIQPALRTAGSHSHALLLSSKVQTAPSDFSQCLTQLCDGHLPALYLIFQRCDPAKKGGRAEGKTKEGSPESP